MSLDSRVDYIDYLYTCNRCRSCAADKSPELRPMCPAYDHFGYFTYSGGGKAYVCQGILEGKVEPSPETVSVAMNCIVCGACASMCPPGFDTLSFIRDLRDYLVKNDQYINDTHKDLIKKARNGKIWEGDALPDDLPVFDGSQELLLFLGDRERAKGELIGAVRSILDAAGVSWGILKDEPASGAPLEDLGDLDGFKAQAEKTIALLNSLEPERMVVICPHDAAVIINDYFNVGDLEIDVITLPTLLSELIEESKLKLKDGDAMTVTYHDPCRLGRFLEEDEPPRQVLEAIQGVKLVEMIRNGEGAWCCGSGAWAGLITPELSEDTADKRIEEAQKTGAEYIITACSYCTDMLKKISKDKQTVIHLAELVAARL